MPGLIEAEILPANTRFAPVIIDLLCEWGFPTWEEKTPKETKLKVTYSSGKEKSLDEALARLSELTGLKLKLLKARQIEETDYLKQWSKHLKPFFIGEKIEIVPLAAGKLETVTRKNKRIPVYLSPGLAFGTGSHPSTSLALELLEKQIKKGARVLDVGTGSGILIIAARKLGAGKAVALDYDRQALENAVFNSKLNQTEDIIFYQLSLSQWKDFNFDLVLANLTAQDILENYRVWQSFSSALLIFSGILNLEKKKVESFFKSLNFRKIEERKKEGWVALVYEVKK